MLKSSSATSFRGISKVQGLICNLQKGRIGESGIYYLMMREHPILVNSKVAQKEAVSNTTFQNISEHINIKLSWRKKDWIVFCLFFFCLVLNLRSTLHKSSVIQLSQTSQKHLLTLTPFLPCRVIFNERTLLWT